MLHVHCLSSLFFVFAPGNAQIKHDCKGKNIKNCESALACFTIYGMVGHFHQYDGVVGQRTRMLRKMGAGDT